MHFRRKIVDVLFSFIRPQLHFLKSLAVSTAQGRTQFNIGGGLNLLFNPLSARIFTVFGHSLLEDRVLHKEAWVAKLLGTHLSI